ncbi:MAG: hypothetical protein ACYTXE_38000 [Nostoc sp.]
MKLNTFINSAFVIASIALVPGIAIAQTANHNKISLINLGRAENLAREAAEKANGGLQHYRAENSMYGPAERSPHTYDGHGTWTFTFNGHSPDSDTPTVKSIVTVSRTRIVHINYNRHIRSRN